MNKQKLQIVSGLRRVMAIMMSGVVLGLLTACQTMGGGAIPASESENFTPLTAEKRVMNQVKIKWEVREDVAQFCAKAAQMTPNQAYWSPPMACAVWNVPSKECTIVTGKETNHVTLGHELRHCFEGHFHH
jgi:hypothetical protein